jgi:hypothetical protein
MDFAQIENDDHSPLWAQQKLHSTLTLQILLQLHL